MSGQVVDDAAGTAVVGARVRAWDSEPTGEDRTPEAVSDDAGRFAIDGVPVDRTVHLVVTADGRVPRELRIASGAPRDVLEIRLEGGGVLEGEVRDAEGRPSPGSVVTALRIDEPLPPRRRGGTWYVGDAEVERARSLLGTAICDGAGRFEIRGVALRSEIVAVVQLSDRREARSRPATFSIAGERIRRDVQVERPGSLLVRFEQRARIGTSIEVGSATVWFNAEGADRRPDGSFLFDELAPGAYAVLLFPNGGPVEARSVEVRAGVRAEVVIGPSPGKVVEGIVVDDQGRPVAYADISWTGAHTIMGDVGEDGRFRLEGITDRVGTLRIGTCISHDETALVGTTVVGIEPGGAPVRIVVGRSPVVTGRVAGVPVGTRLRSAIVSSSLFSGDPPGVREDGRFELPTGEVSTRALLVFQRSGFAPLIVDLPPLSLAERHDVGELRFDAGRTIAGVVLDEKGAAVPGATVIVAEKWIDAERETGADGAYRFERMPDRATELRVDAEGFPVHIVTIPAGSGAVTTIALDRGGLLRVRAVDSAGEPAPGAEVTFMPDGDHPYDVDYDKTRRSRDVGADGRLEVRLQARGHRIVVRDAQGARRGEVERVVVRAGETTSVEVRLR